MLHLKFQDIISKTVNFMKHFLRPFHVCFQRRLIKLIMTPVSCLLMSGSAKPSHSCLYCYYLTKTFTSPPGMKTWDTSLFLYHYSFALSHPSWTFSSHDAPAKQTASWRTPPTPPTVSSSSYHQEDGTGASKPAPPDCSTAFSPGCESPELRSPRPPLKPHANPLPPETWTPPPPLQNTPQPYHTKEKKLWTFLCNSSVLHTGEWACTNHL